MAKYKEGPRYHIVSVRVNETERETLDKISRESNKSVSDLLREALQMVAPHQMDLAQGGARNAIIG